MATPVPSHLFTPEKAASWLRERVRGTIHADSRCVQPGDGFIAWPGTMTDGRHYVNAALAQGAQACLVEQNGVEEFGFNEAFIASYRGLKKDTALIASCYFDDPSAHLSVLAVTGTNGKTSTAWWLAQALSYSELFAQYRCGLIGTLGIGEPDKLVFNGLTTPDPVLLQQQLRNFVQQGYKACAIEASSIGLAEHRLDSCKIRVAIFTNFTQDHLDYHQNMQAYWQAKACLFEWPGLQVAVVNLDDYRGSALANDCEKRNIQVWTISSHQRIARIFAKKIHYENDGLVFEVCEGNMCIEVRTCLLGDYNVTNLLGVIAGMRAMDIQLQLACAAMACITPVPGRMQCLRIAGQPLVVVDFAHTADALEKSLASLRTITQMRGGQLICIFGCGGDRDALKRPFMARAAEYGADQVVVTSDNPRCESQQDIIDDILKGFTNTERVRVLVDRGEAITQTLKDRENADVILIAGKGHETYQEIQGVKYPFSDITMAQTALSARMSGHGDTT